MKRIYLKPEVFIVKYMERAIMLTASESTRNVGGGPTQDPTNPLTPGVEDWNNSDDDPYQGGGQGSGGAGNRAKGFGAWDEWD
jgi:hypothetical protein